MSSAPRIVSFAMSETDAWCSWLKHHERQIASTPGVQHFAALQLDARGNEPFALLIAELEQLGADWWTYSLDDGRTQVTMTNRWRRITVGQNLVLDYCQAVGPRVAEAMGVLTPVGAVTSMQAASVSAAAPPPVVMSGGGLTI